jgi:hypothetical protein
MELAERTLFGARMRPSEPDAVLVHLRRTRAEHSSAIRVAALRIAELCSAPTLESTSLILSL